MHAMTTLTKAADPETLEKPKRRHHSAEYKLKILGLTAGRDDQEARTEGRTQKIRVRPVEPREHLRAFAGRRVDELGADPLRAAAKQALVRCVDLGAELGCHADCRPDHGVDVETEGRVQSLALATMCSPGCFGTHVTSTKPIP